MLRLNPAAAIGFCAVLLYLSVVGVNGSANHMNPVLAAGKKRAEQERSSGISAGRSSTSNGETLPKKRHLDAFRACVNAYDVSGKLNHKTAAASYCFCTGYDKAKIDEENSSMALGFCKLQALWVKATDDVKLPVKAMSPADASATGKVAVVKGATVDSIDIPITHLQFIPGSPAKIIVTAGPDGAKFGSMTARWTTIAADFKEGKTISNDDLKFARFAGARLSAEFTATLGKSVSSPGNSVVTAKECKATFKTFKFDDMDMPQETEKRATTKAAILKSLGGEEELKKKLSGDICDALNTGLEVAMRQMENDEKSWGTGFPGAGSPSGCKTKILADMTDSDCMYNSDYNFTNEGFYNIWKIFEKIAKEDL